jgi:hypothetical protein
MRRTVPVVVVRAVYARDGDTLVKAGTRGTVPVEDEAQVGRRYGTLWVTIRGKRYRYEIPCSYLRRRGNHG